MRFLRAAACALCAATLLASGFSARGAEADEARLYITRQTNAYGLMDAAGNSAAPRTFEYIEPLSDAQGGGDLCYIFYESDPATGALLAGLLNDKGDMVLEARYNHITMENGMLITEEGDPEAFPPLCAAYTPSGAQILPPNKGWLSFNGFLLRRSLETATVYYHADGSPAPAFNRYEYVRGAYGSLCAAGEGGKAGFIDTEGNIRIPFIYDSVTDFLSGTHASVILDGQSFLIDRDGHNVYGPTPMYMYFDGACWIGNCAGRAMLMDDKLSDLMNVIGEHAYIASVNGFYQITDAQSTYYVDASGAPVMQGPYSSAESIGSGLFCVTYQNGDDDAHVVGLDDVPLFNLPGMLTAYMEHGYVIVVTERYGRVRYGMYAADGAQLLAPVYERILPVSRGVIEARLSTESGYLRPDGSWLYCVSDYDRLVD